MLFLKIWRRLIFLVSGTAVLTNIAFCKNNETTSKLQTDGYKQITETRDPLQLVCSEKENEQPDTKTLNRQNSETYLHRAPDQIEGNDAKFNITSWSVINVKFPSLERGGRFTPKNKNNSDKIVIIIPYRERMVHLKISLNYLHAFLQRQNANYVIYVVEMESDGLFRKTSLMNAGFLEVMKRENTSCVIFHDVDMLPMDDNNIYRCSSSIRRLISERHPADVVNLTVSSRDKPYDKLRSNYFGGALAFPTHYFRALNGYSNLYTGWGGEDEDMLQRVRTKKIPLVFETSKSGRYHVLSHVREPVLLNRDQLVKSASRRMDKDGLSSVRYDLKKIEERVLFTWILIQTKTPACVLPGFVMEHQKQTHIGYTIIKRR